MRLDAGKVVEARAKEVTYLRDKRVYDRVLRHHAVRNKWKIIRTRWIDINKGDDENPNYRSRLVGKEFNDGQMDGLFAGTPPLEALRFLVHEAATVRSGEEMGSKVIMINDVARAFFEAPAMRNICIEIPKEDVSEADKRHDKVGHLRMSLYGTRDAAMNWQEGVAKEMRKWGFTRGQYNPCLYYHRQRNIRTFLHGLPLGGCRGRSGSGTDHLLPPSCHSSWPNALGLDLEATFQGGFKPLHSLPSAIRGEVVTMQESTEVTLPMVVQARIVLTTCEPPLLHLLRHLLLPIHRRVTRSI